MGDTLDNADPNAPPDPFRDFINRELNMPEESGHDSIPPEVEQAIDDAWTAYQLQVEYAVRDMAKRPSLDMWEDELLDEQRAMVMILARELAAHLKKTSNRPLTNDQWRSVIRFVATATLHLENHVPPVIDMYDRLTGLEVIDPFVIQQQDEPPGDAELERMRERLHTLDERPGRRLVVRKSNTWQDWLSLVVLLLCVMALGYYSLRGIADRDTLEEQLAARDAQIAEMQATIETLYSTAS